MRKKAREKITLCLLIGLIVFAVGTPLLTTEDFQSALEKENEVTLAYTPHDAIYIHSNA